MKENNEIEGIKLRKVMKKLAYEKLCHISDILKYKFSLNNTCEVNKEEYSILIENEGNLFGHVYYDNDLIELDVNIGACILQRAFWMCTLNETKEYEQ